MERKSFLSLNLVYDINIQGSEKKLYFFKLLIHCSFNYEVLVDEFSLKESD